MSFVSPMFLSQEQSSRCKSEAKKLLSPVRGDEDATAFGGGVGLTVDASEGKKRVFVQISFIFEAHFSG